MFQVTLDPAKKRPDLAGFLEKLRTRFRPLAGAKLTLRVSVGRNRGLLLALAKGLPQGAPGFCARLFTSDAAGASLAPAGAAARRHTPMDKGVSAFDGDLLAQLDWDAALRLIETCVTADPAWLQGAYATLLAEPIALVEGASDIAWCAGVPDMTRHLRKKTTAWLQAFLDLDATDTATALRRKARELEPLSGLPLGKPRARPEPDVVTAENEREDRVKELALFGEEIVAVLAEKLRPRDLRWGDFPRLRTNNDAYKERMQAIVNGAGRERVNFPALARSFARSHLPGFQLRKDMDAIELAKPLNAQSELVVTLTRVHFHGMGKTFGAALGVRMASGPAAGSIFGDSLLQGSLFRFFDHACNPRSVVWPYACAEELALALEETRRLLDFVLPEFEQAWREFLETGHSALLEDLPQHGALSFHGAVFAAARALARFELNFTCVIGAWPSDARRSDPVRQSVRGVSATGQIGPGQAWHIRFADPVSGRSVIVVVPWRGRVKFEQSYGVYVVNEDRVMVRRDLPPGPEEALMLRTTPNGDPAAFAERIGATLSDIADTQDVMACAEAAGGAEFRQRHSECSVSLNLRVELKESAPAEEFWLVAYSSLEGGTRDYLRLRIPARPPLSAQIMGSSAQPLATMAPRGSA